MNGIRTEASNYPRHRVYAPTWILGSYAPTWIKVDPGSTSHGSRKLLIISV